MQLSTILALHCLPGFTLRAHMPLAFVGEARPPCIIQGLLEFLRSGAGGEGASHRRCTGKPRFLKPAPRCTRKSSWKRHGCFGSRYAPQASSFPGKRGGGRTPPTKAVWQECPILCWLVLPPISAQRGQPRFALLPVLAHPTPEFPYGLFTGPS